MTRLWVLVLVGTMACGDDGSGAGGGGGGDGGTGGDPGGDGDGGATSDPDSAHCTDASGAQVVCACMNGVDDDGDGLADGADPECSGPYDHDEATFATGIPGDNSDPYAQDCFFDGDSGGGNDGCRWDIRCEDLSAPYEGQHCNNNTTVGCESCRTLTPNGCDCFGCCDIYVDGTPHRVRIQDGCTAEVIDDPALCPPCDFVVDCMNPCDFCIEDCLGDDPEWEDAVCNPGEDPPPTGCDEGVTPCAADGSCPDTFGCVTGCCVPIIQ